MNGCPNNVAFESVTTTQTVVEYQDTAINSVDIVIMIMGMF